MNPKNIEEYVINKVLEQMEQVEKLKKENEYKDKKIKKMKRLLVDNNICFECVCSRCNRKIKPDSDDHSHNSHVEFPTLCYMCFFKVL